MKGVCEEKEIAVAHTNNINQQFKNKQATVSDMEYYQIKIQSRIDDLTSDLFVSCKSANEIKTNWTTKSVLKFHLDNIFNN